LFDNAKIKLCIIDGSTYFLKIDKKEFMEYCQVIIAEKLDFNEFHVNKMSLKEINLALDEIINKYNINLTEI
jgi:hypothetical protein